MSELPFSNFSSEDAASPTEVSTTDVSAAGNSVADVSAADDSPRIERSVWARVDRRPTEGPNRAPESLPGPRHSPDPVPGPVPDPRRSLESDADPLRAAAVSGTSPTDRAPLVRADPTRRLGRGLAGAAVLVAVAVGGGVVGSALTPIGRVATSSPSEVSSVAVKPVDLVKTEAETPATFPSGSHGDVATLIAKTIPSVVDISVQINGGRATGSGFVISSDGRIVTNAHVVSEATSIEVTFADKSTARAAVVGVDRTDDLAVIHVERTGLPALTLGSSALLRMGDPVVAIGSALALTGGPTATEGIVSALDRTIDTADGEHLAHLLQTDAAINPGNSGGPLLTLDGKVIGINSAGSTDAQNIGFAIAIDTAKPIVGDLAKGHPVSRGFLGVSTIPIDSGVVAQYGLDVDHGLLVVEVSADSAADQAGLRTGDVIVAANGKVTDEEGVLSDLIRSVGAGKRLTLKVRRDGSVRTLSAVLSSHLA